MMLLMRNNSLPYSALGTCHDELMACNVLPSGWLFIFKRCFKCCYDKMFIFLPFFSTQD